MAQASDSQIAMWRGAIALAWADRTINGDEKKKLLEYFKDNIYLSDDQRATLAKDLDKPIKLDDVWKDITDTHDRAHLIDIAPSLFASHGGPTAEEKALFDKMYADQMATIDTNELEKEYAEVRADIPVEQAKEDALFRSEFKHWGPLDALIYHLDKTIDDVFGIDPAEGQ